MTPSYLLQALTTAVLAPIAGGLIGWCAFGLVSTVRRILRHRPMGPPSLFSGMRPAHR
jgi:hypothetical protein